MKFKKKKTKIWSRNSILLSHKRPITTVDLSYTPLREITMV